MPKAATAIRTLIWHWMPGLAEWVRSLRVRRKVRQFNQESGIDRLTRAIIQQYGPRILHGPFRGMMYVDQATGSSLLPKLLGTYELELAATVERAIAMRYKRVIDVGSAEGYYAVGFAAQLPGARIFAFDVDPLARRLCRRLAALNGVADRVEVRGPCNPRELRPLLGTGTLLISDCEGFELTLLDPGLVPELKLVDMLVETHDHIQPGISDEVVRRFAATHDVSVIFASNRSPDAVPELGALTDAERFLAMNEFRPASQRWLWLVSITARSGSSRATEVAAESRTAAPASDMPRDTGSAAAK